MTSVGSRRVPRQRTVGAPRLRTGGWDVPRPGIVYVIIARHDVTGEIGVGYIGQTRQRLEERLAQHKLEQPFSDRILYALVVEEGMWTNAQLDKAEIGYIRRGVVVPGVTGRRPQRPWYNIEHNRDNPGRIPPWDAVRYRQARDPGWVPVKVPRQRGVWAPVAAPPSRLARWWQRRRWWVIGLGGTWMFLFSALWQLATPALTGDTATALAAIGATVPFAVAVWAHRVTRPKRRRRRR